MTTGPATLHFATIYDTDVFFSLEEFKMAAPGLSCQAFLEMLDRLSILKILMNEKNKIK